MIWIYNNMIFWLVLLNICLLYCLFELIYLCLCYADGCHHSQVLEGPLWWDCEGSHFLPQEGRLQPWQGPLCSHLWVRGWQHDWEVPCTSHLPTKGLSPNSEFLSSYEYCSKDVVPLGRSCKPWSLKTTLWKLNQISRFDCEELHVSSCNISTVSQITPVCKFMPNLVILQFRYGKHIELSWFLGNRTSISKKSCNQHLFAKISRSHTCYSILFYSFDSFIRKFHSFSR